MPGYPAPHQEVELRPVGARLVSTWPVGSFVENLAPLDDEAFAICVHNAKAIYRVTLAGARRLLAATPAPPAGILVVREGVFFAGGEPGQGPHHIYKVAADGQVERFLEVPDSLFLNGFTPGMPGFGYVVDSFRGRLIEIDFAAAASRVVLAHELLEKCSDQPLLPGANGVKLGADEIYISNTDRALILRAGIGRDGAIGGLDVVAEGLRGDDLALDVAGNLYVTTHIHNQVIRLAPDDTRLAIAGPEEGMAGSTACAFHPGDPGGLYVTTNGGMSMPLDGAVREGRLVRLDVGVAGRPLGGAVA